MSNLFEHLPNCPQFCAAVHDGTNDTVHCTLPGGPFGEFVVVNMANGEPPDVRLADAPTPELVMTPDGARLLAFHLWAAAGLADRYAIPLAADELQRRLRELLEDREAQEA